MELVQGPGTASEVDMVSLPIGIIQHRVVPTVCAEAGNTMGSWQSHQAVVHTAANDREKGTVMHCDSTFYFRQIHTQLCIAWLRISIRSVRRRRGESPVQKDLACATDGGHG